MIRNLTSQEIDDIIQVIPPNKCIVDIVSESIRNNQIEGIKKQLKTIKLYPSLIPQLKSEIEKQYYKTMIQPGESVGIITAQSIGERQTQSTLNSFHFTGLSIKTVVTGVPRFSELLNATKDPKAESCYIYFNRHIDDLNQLRLLTNHTIMEINLKKIYKNYEIFLNQTAQDDWYIFYNEIFDNEYNNFNTYIRFQIDKQILFDYTLTLQKICKNMEKEYKDIKCVFSPDELGIIDIYIDMSNVGQDIPYLTLEECQLSYIEGTAIPALCETLICGIPKIQGVFPVKKDDGEYIMETEGSNLKQLFCNDLIDYTRTISNNMWEIYHTLGVEAARTFLIEEFSAVVASDGTYVNDSHVKLLVDIMTYTGCITSISRYGMKKETCGPLAKASFEESLENFMKAGASGEIEYIKGVSASIMMGKIAKIGSGICDILVDIERLPERPSVLEDEIRERLVI